MKIDKEILAELHAQGFKRADRTTDVITYEKVVDDRRLEVQLWSDGGHRVSHFLNGRSCTIPTDFENAKGLVLAIQRELTRTDHPPKR